MLSEKSDPVATVVPELQTAPPCWFDRLLTRRASFSASWPPAATLTAPPHAVFTPLLSVIWVSVRRPVAVTPK